MADLISAGVIGGLIGLLPLSYPNAVVAAGAAVLGLVAGVVGVFAVLRSRSLVADALSHATLPGVAVAFLLTGAKDASTLLVGAGCAGLVGAVAMVGIERTGRLRPDAAIGVVLSGFFALGIVLITYIGTTGAANQAGLETYLFGQAAGLLQRDVATFAVLGGTALLVVVVCFRALKTTLFDPAFAGSVGLPVRLLELLMTVLLVVAVIVGVRTVGAILMVAMIVVPAAAARQLTGRLATMLPLAGVIGAAVGVTGSLLSAATRAPTGPVIVLVGAAVVAVALLVAPERGVLWRQRRLRRDRRRALADGLLVDVFTAWQHGAPTTPADLGAATGRSPRTLRRTLSRLERGGLLTRDVGAVRLTEAGTSAARQLLERRELWSAWLEHGWRLELADAREPEPTDLRGSLGDEAADRLQVWAGSRR